MVIPAVQTVLKEMGVWQRLMERGCFRWLNRVALVDPRTSVVSALRAHRPMSVQRIVLDEELAQAARQAGAHVAERHCVTSAKLSDGLWTVTCAGGIAYQALVLVCADGAESRLARQLGLVVDEPNALGERVFLGPADGERLPCDLAIHVDGHAVRTAVREVDDYVCQTTFRTLPCPQSTAGFLVHSDTPASHRTESCAMRVGGVPRAYGNQGTFRTGDCLRRCDPNFFSARGRGRGRPL